MDGQAVRQEDSCQQSSADKQNPARGPQETPSAVRQSHWVLAQSVQQERAELTACNGAACMQ